MHFYFVYIEIYYRCNVEKELWEHFQKPNMHLDESA